MCLVGMQPAWLVALIAPLSSRLLKASSIYPSLSTPTHASLPSAACPAARKTSCHLRVYIANPSFASTTASQRAMGVRSKRRGYVRSIIASDSRVASNTSPFVDRSDLLTSRLLPAEHCSTMPYLQYNRSCAVGPRPQHRHERPHHSRMPTGPHQRQKRGESIPRGRRTRYELPFVRVRRVQDTRGDAAAVRPMSCKLLPQTSLRHGPRLPSTQGTDALYSSAWHARLR